MYLAREAQLVEQSIEAALVVSSSLILGNRYAGIGLQVPLRTEWLITVQVRVLLPIFLVLC